MEVGGRVKIKQGGITTTLPYPSQGKAKRIRCIQTFIFNHQDNTRRPRRNEMEPDENYKAAHGRIKS
jgi:hypothetical protein